jgi:hypothetical protein
MKFKISILLAVVLFLVIQSCKKSLIEKPVSSLSTSTVFTSEDGLKKAIYGVYQGYDGANFVGPIFTFAVTEAGQKYATFGMSGAFFGAEIENYSIHPTDGPMATNWVELYTVISRANTIIANASKAVDAATAELYIAEAKTLRAYAYFMLVRLYGDVPLVTEQITSLSQQNAIFGPRVAAKDVYTQIVTDLQEGESKLPDLRTGPDIGRVTSGAAKAILGKVYLTMAGAPLKLPGYFQKAVDELTQITSNQSKYGYALSSDFASIFSETNERNSEIILSFSQFYSAISTNSGSVYPFLLLPNGYSDKDEQTCFGFTKAFYNLYENSDSRRDETLVSKYLDLRTNDSVKYVLDSNSYIDQVTKKIVGIKGCGISYGKLDRSARPSGSVPWGHGTDQVHLRYSDVLLMLAEASNEVGKTGDALSYLNRVRTRAHTSLVTANDQAGLRAAIREERLLELVGEYTTVFDIRRWGTLHSEIAAMSTSQTVNRDLQPYDPKLELYPIPQAEIYANPNLKQNPGY